MTSPERSRRHRLIPETLTIDMATNLLAGLFLLLQGALLGIALWPACWLVLTWGPTTTGALHWALLLLGAFLLFNYAYILALLLLRLVIPRMKEGFYPRQKNGAPPREGLLFMLNAFLTSARYLTPWAAMVTSVLVNVFPLHFFYRRLFGPDTPTRMLWDVCYFLDPSLVRGGKNIQVGFRSVVICHIYDQRGLLIKGVRIGDFAVVGGESTLMPGVEVGHHALVGSRSLVLTGTVIKPYELWAGTPARKIRDIPPEGYAEAQKDLT